MIYGDRDPGWGRGPGWPERDGEDEIPGYTLPPTQQPEVVPGTAPPTTSANIPTWTYPFYNFPVPGSTRPRFNVPNAPGFMAPPFNYPTLEQMYQEPGYQFRLGQGVQALEQSAAAHGNLLTGGTAKGIQDYGQQFAAAEYANVFNRALDEYDRRYQAAKDIYAPQLLTWQARTQADQRAAEIGLQQEWSNYWDWLNDMYRREALTAGM